MIKFRMYFDKDKEAKWLNELAEKGLLMKGFCLGFFSFEKGEAGAYEYQVDFGGRFFSVSKDYRQFMEEQGIEIVQLWGPWVVLRRRKQEKPFELYSDAESRITYYTKALRLFKIVTIVEILMWAYETLVAFETGELSAGIAAVVAALMVAVIGCAAIRTKKKIRGLKEELGLLEAAKSRTVSPWFYLGICLNAATVPMAELISENLVHPMRIVGIALICFGLFRTMRNSG